MKLALVVIFSLMVLIGIVSAFAADATLKWKPNTEPDLEGYKIKFGKVSCTDLGPLQPLVLNGVAASVGKNATTYFHAGLPVMDGPVAWRITAFDTAGNESAQSNCAEKVLNQIPPMAPVLEDVTITP